MPYGWVVLWGLTTLAAIDALGLAVLASRSRVERLAVATAAFFALTATPSLVLGYLDLLTRARLAGAAACIFAAIFAALARTLGARQLLGECRDALFSILEIVPDTLRQCARARSVIFVGAAWASALIAYAFFEAWRIPNVTWDALIYHEPIIGFALQNHGFAMVALPPNATIQAINGYPKLCEMTCLWFVAFTDRTWIELPNLIALPALACSAFLIVRRFADRLTAIGWASVLVFMPQLWSELCLVAIDVQVAFFAVMALHFATRPSIRIRDGWCTWLALGLLLASKGSGLTMTPPIALVASLRLARQCGMRRWRATAMTVASGAVLLVGIAIVPLVRNWRAFHNPVWPVTLAVPRLGIAWKGILTLREIVTDEPLRDTFKSLYENPGTGLADVIRHGFGYAIPWVVFPLAVLGLVRSAGKLTIALVTRTWSSDLLNLGLLILLGAAFTWLTPTLGRNSRYNVHILVCLLAVVSWLLSTLRWQRFREGILGASIVLSIMPLFWMNGWLWSFGATDDWTVAIHPFGSRAHLEHPNFELLAAARDSELGAGDVAAVDEGTLFIGELWNFEFTNDVKMVNCGGESRQCLRDLDALNAKWVSAGSDRARKTLDASPKWEVVGKMTSEDGTMVYRRKNAS